MHQRRCRVLDGLDENPLGCNHSNSDTTSSLDSGHEIDQSEAASFISPENVDTKPGIYLSKTNEQWSPVNSFFKQAFEDIDFDSDNADANSVIHLINETLDSYFKENYGTVKCQVDKALVLKYKEYSAHSLKKALKCLKSAAAPLSEVRYVSRLL